MRICKCIVHINVKMSDLSRVVEDLLLELAVLAHFALVVFERVLLLLQELLHIFVRLKVGCDGFETNIFLCFTRSKPVC